MCVHTVHMHVRTYVHMYLYVYIPSTYVRTYVYYVCASSEYDR